MKEFDVLNIPLEGNNLIEASAGTGKTYSIAVLVLRLVLEKNISIEQILMVTFTNAAVAEMDIRIRQFLRKALEMAQGKNDAYGDDDPIIKILIDRSIKQKGKATTIEFLNNALLFLDETSIFTIHSFCQHVLSDYAFETNQIFDAEITEDQSGLIENAVNRFWRNNITVLELPVLEALKEKGFSRDMLMSFANDIFNGKKLKIHTQINQNDILPHLNLLIEKKEKANEEFHSFLTQNWQKIKEVKIRKNTNLFKIITGDDIETFKDILIRELSNPEIKLKSLLNFDFLFDKARKFIQAQDEFENYKTNILVHFLDKAQKQIVRDVESKKSRMQVLSFHDLIKKTHEAVMRGKNTALHRELRKKYKAVFIDEFQDTDYLQYDIFKKVFIDHSILFFIGDPKQLIYSWRGADLNTYLKAKKDIGDRIFTMKYNYRSVPELIEAMNVFFPHGISCRQAPVYNGPFCLKDIEYIPVQAGREKYPRLYYNNEPAKVFDIVTNPFNTKKDQFLRDAVYELAFILKHFTLEGKKVSPADIGVLVRTKKSAKKIKELLSQFNIPAIIVDDTKVIDTPEAMELYHILYAVQNLRTSDISRALLTSFTGFTTADIKNMDLEKHRIFFMDLKNIWRQSGIYAMIMNFVKKYNVREVLLASHNPYGKRTFSNLMQLTEILNEKELYDNYSPEKLIDSFKKAMEGSGEINKYEQRLESDEIAVNISTIHKSKGLSYNIVILPDINTKPLPATNSASISYLDEEGFWISFDKTEEEIEKYTLNSEQENRRLLYVAITRAVHKCIIMYDGKEGTLNSFVENLPPDAKQLTIREAVANPGYYYDGDEYESNRKPLQFTKKIAGHWQVTSFSNLDISKHAFTAKESTGKELELDYDRFVFETLPKGMQTGLVIHEILENLDFPRRQEWEKTIASVIYRKAPVFASISMENYIELFGNILETTLSPLDFNLTAIPSHKRFNELEFFFSFEKMDIPLFKSLFQDIMLPGADIKGVMHGFIDLVFEHKGKFYILDWKTNFLGNTTGDYDKEALQKAMMESNYHLQYLIYTVALVRFLRQKVENFDYDKHFGGVYYLFIRGMRKGENTGIYYTKPSKERILALDKMLSGA